MKDVGENGKKRRWNLFHDEKHEIKIKKNIICHLQATTVKKMEDKAYVHVGFFVLFCEVCVCVCVNL